MDKSILLICETGISAALFVSKILESLREKDLAYDIDYSPVSRVNERLEVRDYDYLLLTPQVSRYKEQLESIVTKENCTSKIVFISNDDFMTMNVERIVAKLT